MQVCTIKRVCYSADASSPFQRGGNEVQFALYAAHRQFVMGK